MRGWGSVFVVLSFEGIWEALFLWVFVYCKREIYCGCCVSFLLVRLCVRVLKISPGLAPFSSSSMLDTPRSLFSLSRPLPRPDTPGETMEIWPGLHQPADEMMTCTKSVANGSDALLERHPRAKYAFGAYLPSKKPCLTTRKVSHIVYDTKSSSSFLSHFALPSSSVPSSSVSFLGLNCWQSHLRAGL